MMTTEEKELLLELLDYAGCRASAEETAARLEERFGTFPDLLRASVEELTDSGLSEQGAVFLNMILPTVRHCKEQTLLATHPVCDTAEKLGEICCTLLRHFKTEQVCALLLDDKMRLDQILWLSTGSITSAWVPIPKLIHTVLRAGASFVVLAHNHPDGDPDPSEEDKFMTAELEHSFHQIRITLLEHFVVADDDYFPLLLHGSADGFSKAAPASTDFYSVAMRKKAGLVE